MFRLDDLFERAARAPKRVLFPESEDPRVLKGAAAFGARCAGEPRVLDQASSAAANLREAGLPEDAVGVLEDAGEVRDRIDAVLKEQGIEAPWRDHRLYRAAAAVRAGVVDGTVAGAVHTTAETVRAALKVIGTAEPGGIASSSFLIETAAPTPAGDRVLAFADAGLIPDPDPETLAEIARQTAASYRRRTGVTPRVALLSFSTKGSASHPRVERVVEAVRILRASNPDFPYDGELQLDAALVPEIAKRKAPGSRVAGRANVLVFPNLDAGNLAYKTVERLGGATAVGPLFQGFAGAVNDLSRGCSERDVSFAAAVTALDATEAS